MVSFVLPQRIQILVTLFICLFWAARDSISNHKMPFKQYKWALFLGSTYLLYVLFIALSKQANWHEALFKLEQKLSLFLLPFAFLLFKPKTRKILSSQGLYFVLSCLLVCALGNLYFLFGYAWQLDRPIPNAEYRGYFEDITDIHPTYMGIYLCFATSILLLSTETRQKLKKWQYLSLLFSIFIFILTLMPKAPVVALFIIVAYYCWLNRRRSKTYLPILGVLSLALFTAFVFIPFSSQRVGEYSALLNASPTANPALNSFSMRQIILTINMNLLHHHWLLGVGPVNLDHLLNAEYTAYSQQLHYNLGVYNTHNEYLNQWLSFGLIGLLLFLGILGTQFVKAYKWRNHLYLFLLITLSVTFSTENVLSRQRGVLFYTFFTSLFFFNGINALGGRKKESVHQQLSESEVVQEEEVAVV
ncbi:O-antigen ligase family protein [Tellurirhabdus bombi]|uniref:O-antigen ligase family protein n=1 Tax=Tellurirhabdus bombi TaxID=2907205 RepID=UPI001F1FCF17|nr:O-antigen ligase family protein [Tellurirhabdus bombi]